MADQIHVYLCKEFASVHIPKMDHILFLFPVLNAIPFQNCKILIPRANGIRKLSKDYTTKGLLSEIQ